MLTLEGCLARRKRLWASLPADVEWILVADPRHVQYLCNFWVQPLSFSTGERGWLCLERSGRATLLGDNFALRAGVHKPFVDREIVEKWYDHKHSVINRDHALLAALKQLQPDLQGRKGLVEAEVLPVAAADLLGVPPESRKRLSGARSGAAVHGPGDGNPCLPPSEGSRRDRSSTALHEGR